MHELSIVLNIIGIVEGEAKKAGARSVTRVELDIGRLSTIEPMAFDMAWKQAIRRTMLEHAELAINWRQGRATCADCGREFAMEAFYDPCPHCGSYFSEVVAGKEMTVIDMSIETGDVSGSSESGRSGEPQNEGAGKPDGLDRGDSYNPMAGERYIANFGEQGDAGGPAGREWKNGQEFLTEN